MNKIIYSKIYQKIAFSFRDAYDYEIEITNKKDFFEIYINGSIAYSLNDNFNLDKINFISVKAKINKFIENKKIRIESDKVGGLGTVDFDEY